MSDNYPGVYPGTVVSADDPTRSGCLRVRVDQIYGAPTEDERIDDDALPWARPCFPVSGVGTGFAWVPEVGSAVWVMFWGCDPEHPVWLGGWFPAGKVPAEFEGAYAPGPTTAVMRTAAGHVIELRSKPGEERVTITTAKGQKIALDDGASPKISVTTSGNIEIAAAGSIVIGDAAAAKKLLHEGFVTAFNTHAHSGNGQPPTVPIVVGPTNSTTKTTAS